MSPDALSRRERLTASSSFELNRRLAKIRLRSPVVCAPAASLRFEVFERQLLELVLYLAHAETVGDRRVDVACFLCNLHAFVVGQGQRRRGRFGDSA